MQVTPEQIIAQLREMITAKDDSIKFWKDTANEEAKYKNEARKQRDAEQAKALNLEAELKETRRIQTLSTARLSGIIKDMESHVGTVNQAYDTLVETNNENALWILAMEAAANEVMGAKRFARWTAAAERIKNNPPEEFDIDVPENDDDNDCPF